VVGVDRRAQALAEFAERYEGSPERLHLQHGDFLSGPWSAGSYDAVLCLGNTLMEVVQIDVALRLFNRVAEALRPGGAFIIDDLPGLHWPRLAEGDWQEGVSEEDDLQLVWSDRDAVFALRSPPADPSSPAAWRLTLSDRCFRLYTDGLLQLLAASSGLSAPRIEDNAPIVVMRRVERS
jgi:SAM-dependent methyltransferase